MTSDENKAIKAIEKTATAGDTNDRNQQTASSVIEQANAAAERLEKANEEHKSLITRQEELMAKQALGGFSSGPAQPEQPKQPEGLEYLKQIKRDIEARENLS